MENVIEVYLDTRGWQANYKGPHALDMLELFGDTQIPTAFTAQALPETVVSNIQRLNPGCAVRLVG